jgi:hypothetical protein
MSTPHPFADLLLSRRLERAEAHANRRFVESRARLFPGRGSQWIEISGTYAMFDGAGAPTTQTLGLGLFEDVTGVDLTTIEAFFFDRGADVIHEVSPLADAATPAILSDRRYRPVEFTSVMYRPVEAAALAPAAPLGACVAVLEPGQEPLWARTSARGWSEFPELATFASEMGQVITRAEDTYCFLAEIDGRPIATGALGLHGGVALLAGASTIPEGRRRGAQLALLESRLYHAAQQGCDLAMMCAQPGSSSQRNAERHGFRIAYTRTKWRRDRV